MNSASYLETDFFVTGAAQTAASLGTPLDGSQPFTVDAWIRFGSVQDRADALFQDGVFRLGALGLQAYVEIAGFPGLWSDGVANPVEQDTWHYLAAVYDGTQLSLYIDGVLDSQAGVSGQGGTSAQPFILGNNLQGRLASVRVYASALSGPQVKQAMLQPDPQQSYAASFDFTANPPVDRSGNDLPVSLTGNARVRSVVPAVSLVNTAYCQPIRDPTVNPGGNGADAYTIQAWIFVQSPAVGGSTDPLIPAGQAVFVNQALDAAAGVALFLHYDRTVQAYRLASLRGSLSSASNILASNATIPYGQWVNVATTYDPGATSLSLYIGGVLDQSSASFGAIPALATPEILVAGAALATQPASGWTLQGYVQSLDVWSICLSAAQVSQWQNGYPVMEPGLTGHYAFGFGLARNENNGAPVGLADRAAIVPQSQPVVAGQDAPVVRAFEVVPPYAPLPDEQMAEIRRSLSFAGDDGGAALDRLLEEAMLRDVGAPLEHLFGERAGELKSRLGAEWERVRRLMRESPQELDFSITYHRIGGEHVLVHHTPVGSTVVFRAAVDDVDDCTMWKIQLIWTVTMGLLALFGVKAQLTTPAWQFIEQRILNNPQLMEVVFRNLNDATATGLLYVLQALHNHGVLWPLIKLGLSMLTWWSLGRLLVKILTQVFGGPAAVVDTIASLVMAAAQIVYVVTQRPDGCLDASVGVAA